MRPSTKILPAFLIAALSLPCAAAPDITADITISSATKRKPDTDPITFSFKENKDPKHSSVGTSAGLKEGKPLEMLLWSSGGAVAGSLAGPVGTVIGAGAGALAGLFVAIFIVPHNGPDKKTHAAR